MYPPGLINLYIEGGKVKINGKFAKNFLIVSAIGFFIIFSIIFIQLRSAGIMFNFFIFFLPLFIIIFLFYFLWSYSVYEAIIERKGDYISIKLSKGNNKKEISLKNPTLAYEFVSFPYIKIINSAIYDTNHIWFVSESQEADIFPKKFIQLIKVYFSKKDIKQISETLNIPIKKFD